jgi:type IV pilus assembly protein PilW
MSVNLPRQSGISLIEVLVAMVIGLVMLATVSQIYYTSGNVGRTQSDESGMQDSLRVVFDSIGYSLRQAGYNNNVLTSIDYQPIVGTSGGTSTVPDTLTIRYHSVGTTEKDCTGGTGYSAGSTISSSYSAQPSTASGMTNTYVLFCSNGTTSVELARNVVNFKVFYGTDANSDGLPDTNFQDASSVTFPSGTATTTIVAARIELTLTGENKSNILKIKDSGYCSSFLDRNCTTFYNTFTLRNSVN